MSEPNEAIEVTAPSVDEAIKQALDQLGASQDDVVIQVLSTPRSGVLGLGARQARVRVERRAPEGASSGVMSPPLAPPPAPRERHQQRQRERAEPRQREQRPEQPPPQARASSGSADRSGAEKRSAEPERRRAPDRSAEASMRRDESAAPGEDEGAASRKAVGLDEQAREATTILARVLELMGESSEITTTEEDSEGIELSIKGDGSGLLIGRHGQTLDSLEYLVNRVLARRIKDAVPITIDTESYRERRRRQLHRMALSMAEQTKREHVPVTLEPMPPRDRRVVHLALKDDPLITTRSTGEGFMRVVEIIPVGERREGADARGGGRPRGGGGGEGGGGGGRGRQRERATGEQREREQPVGQQGGFKHGQKRMF